MPTLSSSVVPPFGKINISPILEERLREGIVVFNAGASSTILLSIDHGKNYDEVSVMKSYILDPWNFDDILLDKEGFPLMQAAITQKN